MTRPRASVIEIDADGLASGSREARAVIEAAAHRLDRGDVLVLRTRPSDVATDRAIGDARVILEALRRHLVTACSLPAGSEVELDAESRGVPVAPFHARRFLLPHQDGGHCSFLTPSRCDCADVAHGDRIYSSTVYWRRPSHKMYQGFLVTMPGRTPGTTFYYDALAMLGDAFRHQRGYCAGTVAELGGFALENLRRSRALRRQHESRYLTLAAFLGAREPAHHVSPSGPRAESEFWPAQYVNLPNLPVLADACPCGACAGPGARVLCHGCRETLGMSWPQARARYETAIVAARHDLVLANNLTLFHAADSDEFRTLVPMCIVTARAGGDDYEHWLARQWRVRQERPGGLATP